LISDYLKDPDYDNMKIYLKEKVLEAERRLELAKDRANSRLLY